MIKNFLIAGLLMFATPGILFSQELFFWSFDNDAITTSATAQPGATGTAYIFANQAIRFVNGVDIDFTSSDSSVLLLTGGEAISDPFTGGFGPRFDNSVVTIDASSAGTSGSGNWSAGPTFNPVIDETLFDPNYVPGVGHLVARVDYDIIGEGAATLNLGGQFTPDPTVNILPSFGFATVSVFAVPEPSSTTLLSLGFFSLLARRRKILG